MALPAFLLRKLYKKGSLRQVGPRIFALTLHNPLGTATVTQPPEFVINGVLHDSGDIEAGPLDLDAIDEEHPFVFAKGDEWDLVFHGSLLRGVNRVHLTVQTLEYDELDVLIEAEEAASCHLPEAAPSFYARDEEE